MSEVGPDCVWCGLRLADYYCYCYGTTRAGDDVEMGASLEEPSSQRRLGRVPLTGNGLDPAAQEFVPGLLLMEVEREWNAAADGTAMAAAARHMARPDVVGQRRRHARQAKRMAAVAAEAATAAVHNALELRRPLRHAPLPLGVPRAQPPTSPG